MQIRWIEYWFEIRWYTSSDKALSIELTFELELGWKSFDMYVIFYCRKDVNKFRIYYQANSF